MPKVRELNNESPKQADEMLMDQRYECFTHTRHHQQLIYVTGLKKYELAATESAENNMIHIKQNIPR